MFLKRTLTIWGAAVLGVITVMAGCESLTTGSDESFATVSDKCRECQAILVECTSTSKDEQQFVGCRDQWQDCQLTRGIGPGFCSNPADRDACDLCTERSTKLPAESVDLVYICDTYHHFEYPEDTLASIHQALRPGGQLIIVDFERVKGIQVNWILNHVRCGKGTVTDEVKNAGFDFVEEVDLMAEQYVLRFEKRASDEDE